MFSPRTLSLTAPVQPIGSRRVQLSARAAFYLQASIIVSFLAGSIAPTPLYSVYQAAWGFSPITITVVFGIYALAVLLALLTAGSLSDFVDDRERRQPRDGHRDRRPDLG